MKYFFSLLFLLLSSAGFSHSAHQLFEDLKLLSEMESQANRTLPFMYNQVMLGGYVNMPSARLSQEGVIAVGAAYTPPYMIYSLNVQPFTFVELSGNYRVFLNRKEENFGHMGFGDDADRTANVKFALLPPKGVNNFIPSIAVGFEDFYGSQRFYSAFLVLTETIKQCGLEVSLGWGKGRIKHLFGAVAWSPWWVHKIPVLENITLLGEYDATDYEHHHDEHPKGREVNSRINLGAVWTLRDFLQLKVSTLRGKEVAAMASIYYNFGETKGFFPKKDDPPIYSSPRNFEAINSLRTEREFAKELAFAFNEQGFHLVKAYLSFNDDREKVLWLNVINMTYWRNEVVRERIEYLLSSLWPDNVSKIIVTIEENGINIESYEYDKEYLSRYRLGSIGEAELDILSPKMEAPPSPTKYEAMQIYSARKSPWTITMRPRLITFFGSTKGKFKFSFGWIFSPEGYLFDTLYYKLQVGYHIWSSLSDVGDMDLYNPSQLLNVRSDLVEYYKSQTVSLEKAFVQKGWNMGRGFFSRLALGYFEIAYGGVAAEMLYYPVNWNLALGIEAATVLKRDYRGLGFQTKIRKLNGFAAEYVDYVGVQYFFNAYYDVKPLNISLSVKAGQFLAKDKGARFEATKYFPSGLRFSIWYTLTDAHDVVNGSRYYDKGIAFRIPLDVFLTKSSRSMVGYAMSAWLRDAGAVSATGKTLYSTIQSAREY